MTGDPRRCVVPEMIAAFIAGTLSEEESKVTADHIHGCEDCRQVLADVAYIDRMYAGDVMPAAASTLRPWWLAVAAAALAVVAALAFWRPWSRPESALDVLVAAAPRDRRVIEPRLSGGFPWAPHVVHRVDDQPLDTSQMQFVGAAGKVLAQAQNDPSPEARHAAALAHLVAGRPRDATDVLVKLADEQPVDGRIWSDLAAARYALALQTDDPSHFAGALAAVDEALRRMPTLAEARFNRALIVDRLGLRDEARDAWQQYLAVDPSSAWSNEARRHLAKLAPKRTFRQRIERDYALLQNDERAAGALAEQFPQEARMWGESEILSRWARAHLVGDGAAEGHLRLASFFGNELLQRRGERMLRDAVAAVYAASPPRRRVLADAHVAYRDAQDEYQKRRYASAERLFLSAANGFEHASSPLALSARYFAANTAFDQGRNEEALSELESLASTAPADLVAFRAQVQWQMGLAYGSAARWGDALRTLAASTDAFERLGEVRNAMLVREILAAVYDQIGDTRTGWKHRLTVLRTLGETEDRRLQVALDSAARAATIQSQWDAARSFLTLELEMARRSDDAARTARSLTFRALVSLRENDTATSELDLAAASRAISRVENAVERKRLEMDHAVAAVHLMHDPARTILLLDEAIAYHRRHGRRMALPGLHLLRSRTLRGLNDDGGAFRALDDGIAELEQQRSSVPAGEERWGVFGNGDALFDDAIEIAVARGQHERAFAYVERARARQLLESLGVDQPIVSVDAVPHDAVLLEYAALPQSLLIFTVASGRVAVVEKKIAQRDLEKMVAQLESTIAASDVAAARAAAARLYDTLIAPTSNTVTRARKLVIVPDATLSTVPFAALVNSSGRFLIEDHVIVVAPSAAVFARLARASNAMPNRQRLLLMEGPPAGDGSMAALSSAQREAEDVVAAYGGAATIGPKNADRAAFERSVAAADIVHFVGHAVISDGGADAALLLSRSAGPAGRLEARDIASMSLDHTRIVVLAACGSARGEKRADEGTISVARGFLAAGVPSVIATLWPIEDRAAAEFFPRVHRHLAAGVSPAEALRAAQIETIRDPSEPLGMWAAVQVLGT